MQAVNLLAHRYEQLVVVLSRLYATHPDAAVFTPDYRDVLARCMAAKVAYGVSYDDDIEQVLGRLNRWRGGVAPPSAEPAG